MKVKCYEELIAWQKAMLLAKNVYRIQKVLPKEEIYALGDQIRRAAVSIPSNIAEGFGRETDKDFRHFLSMARGSLFEVQTQLELAERLNYVTVSDETKQHITRISKMLYSIIHKLRT